MTLINHEWKPQHPDIQTHSHTHTPLPSKHTIVWLLSSDVMGHPYSMQRWDHGGLVKLNHQVPLSASACQWDLRSRSRLRQTPFRNKETLKNSTKQTLLLLLIMDWTLHPGSNQWISKYNVDLFYFSVIYICIRKVNWDRRLFVNQHINFKRLINLCSANMNW